MCIMIQIDQKQLQLLLDLSSYLLKDEDLQVIYLVILY